MLLFRSEEHVARWCSARGVPLGGAMSVETTTELARIWYSDKLEVNWRRRTLPEAQAVFDSLGLTGDFWQLAP